MDDKYELAVEKYLKSQQRMSVGLLLSRFQVRAAEDQNWTAYKTLDRILNNWWGF